MHLSKGFSLASKFFPLVLLPIVLDLLQLENILQRVRDFNIQFTVPAAIPSLTQALPEPMQQTGSAFVPDLLFGYLGGGFLLLSVAFIIVEAFLKGGFLGCIFAGVQGEDVSIDHFIKCSKKFFLRFFLQALLILFILLIIGTMAVMLGPIMLLLFIGLFILFIYLLLWDYIIVAKNEELIDAAQASFNVVGKNLGKVLSFILPIVLLVAIFSFIANLMVSTSLLLTIIAIAIYGYLGTAVVFGVMSFCLGLLKEEV